MIIILLYTVFFMVKSAIEKYQSKEITIHEDLFLSKPFCTVAHSDNKS